MSDWNRAVILETHRYNPDYSHLERFHEADWEWMEAKGKGIVINDEEGIDERYVVKRYIYVKGEHTFDEFRKCMYDIFRKGCSCAHDCCGHLTGGVSEIKPIDGEVEPGVKSYYVETAYSRNY